MSSGDDERFMTMAIQIAKKSKSESSGIHPFVGAVAARDGKLLGKAYRGQRKADDHAEFTLLEKILGGTDVTGATVYTTLEPCTSRNHPKVPCVERLIERQVSRVVIGMLDPNQNICGRGIRRLRKARIKVELFPEQWMKQVEVQNREFIRDQEVKETRLIACGVGQRGSPYEFKNFADRSAREWILVAQNLQTLLPRRDFLPHVRKLLDGGTTIKVVLTTPEVMKALGNDAFRHFESSVNVFKKFYLSLDARKRKRLSIYFNASAASLSVQVRDPNDPARALLVFTPKWAIDLEPENRLYFVLNRREHKPLFDKVYGAIPGMTQAHSSNLEQMCGQLGMRWAK